MKIAVDQNYSNWIEIVGPLSVPFLKWRKEQSTNCLKIKYGIISPLVQYDQLSRNHYIDML